MTRQVTQINYCHRRGIKKEAAQLTPDCTASNLKSEGWCPSVFRGEYSSSSTFVPKTGKVFLFADFLAFSPSPVPPSLQPVLYRCGGVARRHLLSRAIAV